VTAIKAAIAHGVRPSVMVLGEDSKKKWGKWDFVLAKAYQRYTDEICQQCGYPIYLCHSSDSRIEFEVHKETCFAAAEVERAQDRTKDKAYGARFVPYVVIHTENGEKAEYGDFRLPYYKELGIQRGLIPPVESKEGETGG